VKQAAGKLAFLHRQLWRRDFLYRAALLLGPAPLVGCLVGGAAWLAWQGLPRAIPAVPPWASIDNRQIWPNYGQPVMLAPSRPLPDETPDGRLVGYRFGWQGSLHPLEERPTLEVDLKAAPATPLLLNGPAVDMLSIANAAPASGLFAGLGMGYLVIRRAGVHAIAVRFEREPAAPATCLIRASVGGRRIVSDVELRVSGDMFKTSTPMLFDMEPGLYEMGMAFGCWRDGAVAGPGQARMMVSRPGATVLLPVDLGAIVWPR
jgi:hypothetical protein